MRKKILLLAVIILALVAYFGYNYVMAEPEDISKADADFKIAAVDLASEFDNDAKTATDKYLEKVITVKGDVTNVDGNNITLDEKVNCTFAAAQTVKKGDQLKVKGLLIGVDELFGEIKLDKCSVVE